jgi:DsbC/DsbD-like thiol-disulfide interchange protein
MTFRLSSAPVAISVILAFFPAVGQAQSPSPWVQGFHSRIRLLTGGPLSTNWLGGIEIALDPGFKTYWRTPGDSGLPPRFDWSSSDNVSTVEVKWPPPARHDDAAGAAYIYRDAVILPVIVKPADPAKPVKLGLSIDYGVCKDICIPAHAELSVSLQPDAAQRAVLEKALATQPRPQPVGASADLSVLSLEPLTGDKPGFAVKVRAPAGSKPALFAEGPENWYLSTSAPDSGNVFTVAIEEKPKDAAGPVSIRLTLVDGERSIETDVKLDGDGRPR